MNITQANIDDILIMVKQANTAIMEIYNSNSTIVEFKDDNSPLTQADKASHDIIMKGLDELFPNIPVISEEGDQQENHEIVKQSTYWIVDPIDGTQDFVDRTGEFCIAIGLVDGKGPVFGFVSAPTMDAIYYGGSALGASFKIVGGNKPEPIHISALEPHVIAVSRSRINPPTDEYITKNYPTAERIRLGSMLKQTALAEGKIDIFPVVGQGLSLWDVAAGKAIIEGAGGTVKRFDGSAINWHETTDFKVGDFIARGDV